MQIEMMHIIVILCAYTIVVFDIRILVLLLSSKVDMFPYCIDICASFPSDAIEEVNLVSKYDNSRPEYTSSRE